MTIAYLSLPKGDVRLQIVLKDMNVSALSEVDSSVLLLTFWLIQKHEVQAKDCVSKTIGRLLICCLLA